MSLEYRFACPLPNGMHARPAAALEQVTRPFESALFLENRRTSRRANAKSVLGIVGLDIRHGDGCHLTASGRDERRAIDAVAAFVEHDLPHCDDALPVAATAGVVRLPPVLAQAKAQFLPGAAVVPGVAKGLAVHVGAFAVPASLALAGPADAAKELEQTRGAVQRLVARLDAQLAITRTGLEADIVRAHRAVARDPEFDGHLATAIMEHGATAAGAVASAERTFTAMLAATGSVLLRERALDIRDVCVQLLREIYGDAVGAHDTVLTTDAICLADVLTPGQFLALDPSYLKGLVLAHGGRTSHTVILARARGVPTLVGVDGLEASALNGRQAILDADLGVLVADPGAEVQRYYMLEQKRLSGRRRRERVFASRPGSTADGRRIQIDANVAAAGEVRQAIADGAEGIGLFRTEILFAERAAAPSEEEQYDWYRRAVTDAGGRPVTIRTLDVGGDKPLPYLDVPREHNPFLGHRGVRIYEEFEGLFHTQLRALLRASAAGRLRVMVPMVSRVEEAVWVRSVVAEEQARLRAAGLPFAEAMPLGAMIEVPSAAFVLDRLASVIDFVSIGTNDLLQYFLAADRSNPKVDRLASPAQPAFVRLLKKIVTDAHANSLRIGICGEMAGDTRWLPLLAGMGLDEISMATPLIAAAKAELSGLTTARCEGLVEDALAASTEQDVRQLLDRAHSYPSAPLITCDLVLSEGQAATKAEAIKEAVDRLYVAGRTDRPREVEEAVWTRESDSTGFGHGFAIPHCRTDAVRSNSLVIVKLRKPVDWGSIDGRPVHVVVLLAVRESDAQRTHLAILSALARQLIHEEFRGKVEAEHDPAALCAFLAETLGT